MILPAAAFCICSQLMVILYTQTLVANVAACGYICPRTTVAKLQWKDSVVTYLCMFCQQIPHHWLGIDSFKFVKSRNKDEKFGSFVAMEVNGLSCTSRLEEVL